MLYIFFSFKVKNERRGLEFRVVFVNLNKQQYSRTNLPAWMNLGNKRIMQISEFLTVFIYINKI